MNDTTLTLDETTKFVQPPSRLGISGIFSTPQQNGNLAGSTQTVIKKRTRQQTVTVENSQTSKEIEAIFTQVQNMKGVENPVLELQRQMQKLFVQKEREWEFRMDESKQRNELENEELAHCKMKLKAAQSLLSKMDEFTKQLNNKAQLLARQNGGGLIDSPSHGQHLDGLNGLTTPQSMRTFSPDMLAELTKERDTLREEYGQLENSYSDLFKRYEKMRENCVLLKNSEEELKNIVEEEAAKYERLLGRYQELRDSAAEQLNQANMEIQRIIKQHEENTLGLRCRLKMNESQLQTLNLTIKGKDTQIEELNKMVEDLMRKNGIMDEDDDELDGEYE